MSQLRLSLTVLSLAALPAAAQVRAADAPAGPAKVTQAGSAKHTAAAKAPGGYTIDQFLSPSSPLEISAAKKADKVAWVSYERGMRNECLAKWRSAERRWAQG